MIIFILINEIDQFEAMTLNDEQIVWGTNRWNPRDFTLKPIKIWIKAIIQHSAISLDT